jgi:hypothetical protein
VSPEFAAAPKAAGAPFREFIGGRWRCGLAKADGKAVQRANARHRFPIPPSIVVLGDTQDNFLTPFGGLVCARVVSRLGETVRAAPVSCEVAAEQGMMMLLDQQDLAVVS